MYNMRYAASVTGLAVALLVSSVMGQAVGPTYDPATPARRGQAGLTFLGIGGSARAEAMGGAFDAIQGDPSSVFYDVAGMATLPRGFSVYVNRTDWLSDMTVEHAAFSYKAANVALGVTFISMNYGTITGTVVDLDAPSGYTLTGHISPDAWAAGFFVALPFTDNFSFGAHVKYAVQDFGATPYWLFETGTQGNYTYTAADTRVSAIAVDLGTQYNTGFRNVMITMALQNFGRPHKFVDADFNLPLIYRIGVAADIIELATGVPDVHQKIHFIVDAIDASDALLDAAFGLEYTADLSAMTDGLNVAARVGRRAGDQVGTLSAGGGISMPIAGLKVGIDYSYGDYGDGFSTQQWGITVGLP